MVFKVFCDINVSRITSEDYTKKENICYEFIPKYDDNKENWDPNNSKKNSAISVPIDSATSIKVEQINEKSKTEKETGKEETNPNEDNSKENIKENVSPEYSDNEKETVVYDDIKNEKIKEETLKSSVVDTTELKDRTTENLEISKDTKNIIKKKEILLGKRPRIPLEDITYLFVQEKCDITPKRIRIIKVIIDILIKIYIYI
ncbi:hypothetical protein PIROE2DRAFT_14109 [Piromyces sp. E2]|nr:hypothetical protein PIROE2DRAFT_14109 [Piromyces sp. E2]|eukprot:OUM60186.1 hypothetical protein PIROE2DRAFT_14109 [Piromyces sp. E2]